MKIRKSDDKIKPLKELEKIILKLKSQKKKVATTNGVFDIIHAGHVAYLEEARNLGDILIVGINTNRSVKENKGDKRPINDEKVRMKVIASLEAVDYVLLFDEKDPSKWLAKIKPDFHVKAGDYKMSQIVEKNIVEKNNGKIIIAKVVAGHSTTKIINRILEVYR